MSLIRSKDSAAELAVRKMIHRMGYRFRLHRKDLPGTPDLVFPKLKKAVFVHGCFWHRHPGCKRASMPKTRRAFWNKKFEANVSRDRRVVRELRLAGWSVAIVWECQTKNETLVRRKLERLVGR